MALALLAVTPASGADPAWKISSFTVLTEEGQGAAYTAAGGHPFRISTNVELPTLGGGGADALENLKDLAVYPPPGFFANPAVATRCPAGRIPDCPTDASVGVALVKFQGRSYVDPIFNVIPDFGYPAQFAWAPDGGGKGFIVLPATLGPRSEGYAVTVGTNDTTRVAPWYVDLSVCSYGSETRPEGVFCKSPAQSSRAPFLTNPVDCSDGAPKWSVVLDSWEHPGRRLLDGVPDVDGLPDLTDPSWLTASVPASPVTGCDALAFRPTITARLLQNSSPVQADQPTGLAVDLEFPQNNDPTDLNSNLDSPLPQTPAVKEITAELPTGLSISPSAADGLGACSDLASDLAGDQVHYDSTRPVTCPDASKIGTAFATTPLLATHDPITDEVNGAEPVPGNVYVLKPHPGDFSESGDGRFRILIVLEHARYGINVKLPGLAVADEQTGRLRVHFTDSPQLPVKLLQVNLRSGPRAPLMTPVSCGRFEIVTELLPWGTPQIPSSHPTAGFSLASGPGGSGCPSSPATRPFSPTLSAGPEASVAGRPSPFIVKLTRRDGERELSSFEASPPRGLTASLKGVARCPEGEIAAAGHRRAASERADPSCPASSRVGTVTAAAGPGPNPFYVQGNAYLAGPYKGAPLSVAVVTPTLSGAFDLGNLVFRAGVFVDPVTAQVTIKTDPLPQILGGIPLRLRSIALTLDRPGFTRNPTSCEPMALTASATAEHGPSVALSQDFQVGGCAVLPFRPRLAMRLSGALARSGRPALRAEITAKPGQANIARAALTLPVTELLDYDHIRAVCTKSRYAAGAGGGEACAPASRYGHARLFTPLLDKPLEGPLYLRTNHKPRELPDLVASLDGQIHLDLAAHISSAHGLLRVSLDDVPDVPVEKVVLQLRGGKRGLLVNTADLCRAGPRTSASFLAHNRKRHASRPAVNLSCPGDGVTR